MQTNYQKALVLLVAFSNVANSVIGADTNGDKKISKGEGVAAAIFALPSFSVLVQQRSDFKVFKKLKTREIISLVEELSKMLAIPNAEAQERYDAIVEGLSLLASSIEKVVKAFAEGVITPVENNEQEVGAAAKKEVLNPNIETIATEIQEDENTEKKSVSIYGKRGKK